MTTRRPSPVAVCCTLLVCSAARAQDATWFQEATFGVGLGDATAIRLVAVDLDGDGFPELLTLVDHNDPKTGDFQDIRVYRNTAASGGGRRFVDATAESGVNANPDAGKQGRRSDLFALADVDNDGDPDLVSCISWYAAATFVDRGDRCELLTNDGKGHFTIREGAGLRELGKFPATGFSFLDHDLDGKVDLYVATFAESLDNQQSPGFRSDFLLRGHGDGTFEDVTAAMGIDADANPKYGVNMVDINNDGWPDIATSPYCRSEGNLWINDHGAGFADRAEAFNYQASHGLYRQDSANLILCQWQANPWDYDNDGDMDLLQVLVHGGFGFKQGRTFLAQNQGAERGFALDAPRPDLLQRDMPRSEHFGDYYGIWFDMDNDGLVDLGVVQGTYARQQGLMTDRLFLERQDQEHVLRDVTGPLGLLGVEAPTAFLAVDYDRDGDEDFLLNRQYLSNQVQVFENKVGRRSHFVDVKLAPPPGVNGSAVGARVVVKTAAFTQTRDVYAGEGNFTSERPFVLHFGLGAQTQVESITVRWPTASLPTTVVLAPPIDREVTVAMDVGPGADMATPGATSPVAGCGCELGAGSGRSRPAGGAGVALALLGVLLGRRARRSRRK